MRLSKRCDPPSVLSLNALLRSALLPEAHRASPEQLLREIRRARVELVRRVPAYYSAVYQGMQALGLEGDPSRATGQWFSYHDMLVRDLLVLAARGAEYMEERVPPLPLAEKDNDWRGRENGALLICSHIGCYGHVFAFSNVWTEKKCTLAWRPTLPQDASNLMLEERLRARDIDVIRLGRPGAGSRIEGAVLRGRTVAVFADHGDLERPERNLSLQVGAVRVGIMRTSFTLAERLRDRVQFVDWIRSGESAECLVEVLGKNVLVRHAFESRLNRLALQHSEQWERVKHIQALRRVAG